MRKIIITTIVLLLGIAVMAYYYFSRLSLENDAKDLALQSATNNAAIVVSFKNDKGFYEIIESQDILQQLLGSEKAAYLKTLKSSLINDGGLNSFIQDQPIYLSILPDSAKRLDFLLTVQIRADKQIAKVFDFLSRNRKITSLGQDLYQLKLNDSLNAVVGIQKEVLTFSTSVKLVKDAAIRLTENPFTAYIKANSQFSKNNLLSLFLNFNKAPLLLKNIVAGNLNGELSVFDKQNSFAALNYNFSKERILFNGYTSIDDENNYLTLFEGVPAQTTSIQNILPDNTANYTLYAFDDYPKWYKKLTELQKSTGENNKSVQIVEQTKKDFHTDLNTILPVFTSNQFIAFQLSTGEKLAAVAVSNGEKVKQLLFDVSADYNEEIKIFKTSGILSCYYGAPLNKFSRPYYTFADNYLVVANNASTLQVFLNDYKNNRLLIQTPEYTDAMNQISSKSNITWYVNNKNATDIFRRNIYLPYYRHLRADSGLKSFDTFCYQMSTDQNKFITNLLINKYLKPEIPDSLSNR